MRGFVIAAVLALVGLASPATVSAEAFHLVTLEWPPYTVERAPDQGTSTKIITEALEKAGHVVSISFYPWNRAFSMVETGKADGIFPTYYSLNRAERRCTFSRAFQVGPLGFIENTARPIPWTRLEDLKGRVIGTISGFVNSFAFDTLVKAGVLKVEPTGRDSANVLKVANGRLDMAVIDKNIFEDLLTSDPRVMAVKNRVRFTDRILAYKTMHICFGKSARGEVLARIFDTVLGESGLPLRRD